MAIKIPKLDRQTVDLKPPKTNLLATTQDFVGPNIDKITSLLERTAKEIVKKKVKKETLIRPDEFSRTGGGWHRRQ